MLTKELLLRMQPRWRTMRPIVAIDAKTSPPLSSHRFAKLIMHNLRHRPTHSAIILTLTACMLGCTAVLADPSLIRPLASADLVIEERDGFVAAEAEHFFRQENTDVRAWHRTTAESEPGLQPDADPNHVAGAGGGAYLEILPDTRKNHGEKLIHGENFSNQPGKLAILSYKVHFNTPGKYFVWARTHSTGTEDNGLHVGIDGDWPASGQRMQWTAKNRWAWGSKQRTDKVHTGVPGILYLEIADAGEHIIQFSMREDGFEFDQWLMTTDADFEAPDGPAETSPAKAGALPAALPFVAAAPWTPQIKPANNRPRRQSTARRRSVRKARRQRRRERNGQRRTQAVAQDQRHARRSLRAREGQAAQRLHRLSIRCHLHRRNRKQPHGPRDTSPPTARRANRRPRAAPSGARIFLQTGRASGPMQ